MTVLNELDFQKNKAPHQEFAQLSLQHFIRHKIKAIKTNLVNSKNDERILLEALAHFESTTLLLVSNDIGMRNRAESYSIKSMCLSDFLSIQKQTKYQINESRELLYKQLLNGNYLELDLLLKNSDADFNFFLPNGMTPLIESIRSKNQNHFNYLISLSSTDLNLFDQAKLKMPPMMHASQRHQIKNLEKLFQAGANPYLTSRGTNSGNSALLIAAWDGSLDVIKYLVEHQQLKLSINQADGNGFTPLIKACIKGHIEIVKYLLSKKADIYIRDRDNKTALQYAIQNNHTEIIRQFNNDQNTSH